MKIKFILSAALAGLAFAAVPASAQGVDQRHHRQHDRIAQGVHSGALTRHEAHRLQHQQRSIHREERRMRSRDHGHLTPRERARLEHRENRASRHIYRAKHNHRVR